jgi:hypothetical protein
MKSSFLLKNRHCPQVTSARLFTTKQAGKKYPKDEFFLIQSRQGLEAWTLFGFGALQSSASVGNSRGVFKVS